MTPIYRWINGESSNPDWLAIDREMSCEGQWSPACEEQTNYTRLVSRDALRGEAPMESEAA